MRRVMTTMVGLVLAAGLVGCSSNGTDTDPTGQGSASASSAPSSPGDASSTPAPTGDPSTAGADESDDAAGADGDIPRGCGVKDSQVALMARDWDRVVGSIGREDHDTYTAAFVRRMSSLGDRADGCPAPKALARLDSLARDIDATATTPDYDLYAAAVKAGNTWLEALGFTSVQLSSS